MNTAHTPTPFYYGVAYEETPVALDYKSPGFYQNAGIIGADGTTVVGCDEYHVFNSQADIEFILRACNSHDALTAANAVLIAALREVETIITESAADCRKRMGTRVGNTLVVVRAALKAAKGAP